MESEEPERLLEMKYNTQLRRLLWNIQKLGRHTTTSELARHVGEDKSRPPSRQMLTSIGYDKPTFNKLLTDLKTQGLVREHKKRNMPAFSVTELPSLAEPGNLLHPLFGVEDMVRET